MHSYKVARFFVSIPYELYEIKQNLTHSQIENYFSVAQKLTVIRSCGWKKISSNEILQYLSTRKVLERALHTHTQTGEEGKLNDDWKSDFGLTVFVIQVECNQFFYQNDCTTDTAKCIKSILISLEFGNCSNWSFV